MRGARVSSMVWRRWAHSGFRSVGHREGGLAKAAANDRIQVGDPEFRRPNTATPMEFSISVTQNEIADGKLAIDGMDEDGFFINGKFVEGSVFLLPETVIGWQVPGFSGLKKEHFSLLGLIKPSIELLVIGTGPTMEQLDPELEAYLRSHCALEVCKTEAALSTFNFLMLEDRNVAGAILKVGKI
mmetsp:Transcript_35062/g.56119  ORF Transcript_35062/g.56119 Transcript_35062/m.56119 type:complete len:185 (-) Transcript_35062:1567-2121(-)